MKLSIIIPYYNANNIEEYTAELLFTLEQQLTEEVEVILVDDGSPEPFEMDGFPWVKVIRKENGGVSSARNRGLEEATGEYIAFIDADDMVSEDYIQTIFNKMPFDYLDMSWQSLPGGQQFDVRLYNDSDRLKNPSAVTRAFNRNAIGNVRFNENKKAAEDAQFIKEVCKPEMKVAVATNYLYFYRTYTPNSLTKRFSTGDMETKRIVYHYQHITADMTDLLAEIKRENEHNEVYVLTEKCDLPELNNYAKVMTPRKVNGNELRGEPTKCFVQIEPPPEVDVIIYTSQSSINGIYTWIYAFCHQLHDKYDIAVIHEHFNGEMISRLQDVAYVRRNGDPIKCKTLLMMRINDPIPVNIRFERSIQVVHSTKLNNDWKIPTDRDLVIPVSETVRASWGLSEKPILNLTYSDGNKNALNLISATRLRTKEKGVERMRRLVEKLNEANIPFVWYCYSDLDPCIPGITHKAMTTNIRSEIARADYLVQLSDSEGFCYSIVEALEEGTAVITTPLPVLSEIGFENFIHGYIFGFDMQGDVNDLKTVPQFEYRYNNGLLRSKWLNLLGKGTLAEGPLTICCTRRFRDMQQDRYVEVGEVLTVNHRRAKEILECGYATLME